MQAVKKIRYLHFGLLMLVNVTISYMLPLIISTFYLCLSHLEVMVNIFIFSMSRSNVSVKHCID